MHVIVTLKIPLISTACMLTGLHGPSLVVVDCTGVDEYLYTEINYEGGGARLEPDGQILSGREGGGHPARFKKKEALWWWSRIGHNCFNFAVPFYWPLLPFSTSPANSAYRR